MRHDTLDVLDRGQAIMSTRQEFEAALVKATADRDKVIPFT